MLGRTVVPPPFPEADVLGLDGWVAGLGLEGSTLALLGALLMGFRHAADPDHLAAVATLVMSGGGAGADGRPPARPGDVRVAGRLGLSWGAGHGLTLVLLGLPVIVVGRALPTSIQTGAEVLVGVLIALLALRLLLRRRQGEFEPAPAHSGSPAPRRPAPPPRGRSPLTAFGIGLVHGIGGSAAAGLLLVAATPGVREALLALLVFAGGTALSMALLSALVGGAIGHRSVRKRVGHLVPTVGGAALAFGVWYSLAAAGLVPHGF